ncbi:MAG TPA: DegT/DnrJ/EryC1/StrS family aminotransferase, partial [bacterium]
DSEPETWNMDVHQIADRITSRTRAIMPVHIYGHPADMDPLMDLARGHDLVVIEDAAEAHGARYRDRPVGGFGDAGVFSFYGNKIITTGEGGMVVTNRADTAQRARFLRDQAMDQRRRYWHPEIGYNYRMTNIQAAIGVAQLGRLPHFLARKRAAAAGYARRLQDVPGLTLHPEAPWAFCVYWMYSVLVGDDFGISRDRLAQILADRGVETRPFFPALPTLPPYGGSAGCPRAEDLADRGLNLPSSSQLTDEHLDYICEIIGAARDQGR